MPLSASDHMICPGHGAPLKDTCMHNWQMINLVWACCTIKSNHPCWFSKQARGQRTVTWHPGLLGTCWALLDDCCHKFASAKTSAVLC
jgi:hypothetical protein